jgi:hypothetical protein
MTIIKKVDNHELLTHIEYRETLLYNKFKYRITLSLDRERTSNKGITFWSLVYWRDVSPSRLNDYERSVLIEYLNCQGYLNTLTSNDYRARREGGKLSLAFNNQEALIKIKEFFPTIVSAGNFTVTLVIADNNGDIKYMKKEPNHKFRMYTKQSLLRIDHNRISALKNVLFENADEFKFSPVFQFFINNGYSFSRGYIDFDEESWATMFLMAYDDIFSNYYRLEKIPPELISNNNENLQDEINLNSEEVEEG